MKEKNLIKKTFLKVNFIKKYILQFNLWLGFVISYALSLLFIYYLSKDNFFTSPMYMLLPIFGYFALYYTTPLIKNYLKINKWILLSTFIILGIFAMYVALFVFNWNILGILNNMPIKFNFWKLFLDSAYFEFLISGIVGILFYKE